VKMIAPAIGLSPSAICSPVPRHFEAAGPNATVRLMRGLLIMHIVDTVAPIGHGPAIHCHPTAKILAAFAANGHHAPVAVPVSLLTADRRAANHVTEWSGPHQTGQASVGGARRRKNFGFCYELGQAIGSRRTTAPHIFRVFGSGLHPFGKGRQARRFCR